MINTRSEWEWFIMGVLIAGGKDKFTTKSTQFDEDTNITVDTSGSTSETLNINL